MNNCFLCETILNKVKVDNHLAFMVEKGRGLVDLKLVKAPQEFYCWLFCFGSLVILDVVCRYLSLFLLYIL